MAKPVIGRNQAISRLARPMRVAWKWSKRLLVTARLPGAFQSTRKWWLKALTLDWVTRRFVKRSVDCSGWVAGVDQGETPLF